MRALAAVLTAFLLLAACGEADDQPEDQPEEAAVGAGDTAGVEVAGSADEKPDLDLPGGTPPATLTIHDVIEGNGAEAESEATVTTHYVGVSWSTGEQFDASWDREQPLTFSLAQVIPGWQEGIPGMREGGRRLLIIPPEMAYGDQPPPGSGIAPGETLVFVVDLVEVG